MEMSKLKNIYTILRNIDFDGTVKYYKQRIQMTQAGFEFDVEGHLFSFAQKFYEEILNNISDELEEEINNKRKNCNHEFKADKFDCYGNAIKFYCIDCGFITDEFYDE